MAETVLLGGIAHAKKVVEQAGVLTDGLEDLLQGIASKHEEFVYLLKQRAGTGSAKYSYDRRG